MKQVVWRPMLAAIAAMVVCAGVVSVAHAETATTPAPTAAAPATGDKAVKHVTAPTSAEYAYAESVEGQSDFEKWCQCIKQPCSWFCWGADLQVRNVYQNNNTTLNSNQTVVINGQQERANETEYTRFRARVWGTFALSEDVEFNARFLWEAFNFYEPEFQEHVTNSQGEFDSLNFKFKNLLDTQSTLTVGRQDIFIGDGWLVAEGTPFDGSLTGFFDAVRYQWELANINTTADLIYIHNEANPNAWLHPINEPDPPFWNAEQDESGAVAYFTNKSVENTDISPYFMYKKAESQPQIHGTYQGELYTPGLRVAQKVDENWRWRAEAAYQFGYSDKATPGKDQTVSAWGANSAVQYFLNDPMNNNFRLQYEYLSGDEPDSGKYEGFDILWGRWARWTDLYAYTFAFEQNGRIADYTNLHRIGPGWGISPCDKVTIDTDYYLLFADQSANVSAPGTNPQAFSSNGFFRGQLIESVLAYKLNKHISGHLKGELFFPGNYYSDNNNDIATFLRAEVVLTF
jgi:hypothetical protein